MLPAFRETIIRNEYGTAAKFARKIIRHRNASKTLNAITDIRTAGKNTHPNAGNNSPAIGTRWVEVKTGQYPSIMKNPKIHEIEAGAAEVEILLNSDELSDILGGYKTCVYDYDPMGCPENYRCGENNYVECKQEFFSCTNEFTGGWG